MGIMFVSILLLRLSHSLADVFFESDYDWYQPVARRPVDAITDVVNDLGVRILQQYSGHGNVAFSPIGVAFVLGALYEGSAGKGSDQIAEALALPHDRDVTRIGFRDIHRRLRTYLNADGFLGGLTLNKENTKLRPEYEDVLRFYGFQLDDEGRESNDTTTTEAGTTIESTDESTLESSTTMSTGESENMTMPTTTVSPQQTSENSQTPTSTAATSTTPQTTTAMNDDATEMTTVANATATTNSQDNLTQTTVQMDTSTTAQSTPPTPTTPSMQLTTLSAVSMNATSSTVPQSTETTTLPFSDNTISVSNMPETTTNSQISMESASTLASAVNTITISTSSMAPLNQTETANASMAQITTPTMETSPDTQTTTTATANRRSDDGDSGPLTAESTVPTDRTIGSTLDTMTGETDFGSTDLPSTLTMTEARDTTIQDNTSRNRLRKRSTRMSRGYFSSYPDEGIWMQNLGIWKPYSPNNAGEASVRDSTEISFLVNGCDVASVMATRYVAVLPFAFFPSLHAVAVEFPLDDPRYNILLLMPTDATDTHRLAADLGGKSLRWLRKQLQPVWVRATIPSFMLRGFVTLTPFLQRLGITDVFEPRIADLSPLTPDLGVYVRDVQQSIGVNIRNYMKPDRTHSRNGLFERAGPVFFTAQHPFLYFIVDAETSVTLIAGRVDDPLNSRIL